MEATRKLLRKDIRDIVRYLTGLDDDTDCEQEMKILSSLQRCLLRNQMDEVYYKLRTLVKLSNSGHLSEFQVDLTQWRDILEDELELEEEL